ncbi:leucine-rich repeat-containing protein 42 isoform X2 [Xyrichtys novacula]|uniref:Leucine-rich repeat-containing protein 42 n=1 Tax=Xyrichtys novacula TaxID=13765 RepID=A0AAV1GHR5_XYRNO|nr:leucine-rich repeat-containing protein 42 isoform X2 [Xyrichtys novacula]
MDTGPIYVRERGNLRRVNDIVLAQPKSVSSSCSSCRRTDPFVLRKEHFIFTYNAEGSLRYTTKSLFDITLLFVVDNIYHVDSLVGFPEQIGDKLFAAAEEKHVFLNAEISTKALLLFSDAYGEMVLRSLCLRNRFPLLHERMSEIRTFHSLKSLDLFGCRLGDDHEIFLHLTSSSLASLNQLFIGGNSLSDAGLQKLTAPIRMMKKGLDCLQVLDLSYNPISERAYRYLTCLSKLEKLDLSGTSLKLCTRLKTTIWDLLGLIYSEEPLDTFDHTRCKTEGWAEQVVHQWESNNSHLPKQKKIEESRSSALHFFGRQKFVREVLKAAPLICESAEDAKSERLHFSKPAANNHIPGKLTLPATNHHAKHSCQAMKKRQRQSGDCDRSPQATRSPPSKRLSSSTLTAEDMDLLNSY